jgi:hypothetical protein
MSRSQFLTASIIAAAILLTAAPASAAVYIGRVKDVQMDHLVLTVKNKDHRIYAADKTMVTVDGKKARLANLKPGFRATVNARLIGTRLTASSIAALSANSRVKADVAVVRGMIRAMDRKKSTLTVYNPVDKKSTTFEVRNDTKVTLDGQAARFGDLKKGYSVEVASKAEAGRPVATAIVARKATLRE